VAILVPAAVVAAIALSVLGGGHNVGSLSDVLEGPAVPPAEAASHLQALARREQRAQTTTVAAAPPPAFLHIPIAYVAPPARRRRPVATVPERRRPGKPPAATPHPPAPSPPPPAGSPPPARPHPINQTGSQVAQTVRPLPVAGPAAADAVQAVVNLVDPPA
jgi:hypothetical protein